MANPIIFSSFMGLITALLFQGVWSTTFTFKNNCPYTVWPGLLSAANSAPLPSTGFELQQGASQSFNAPAKWSGRMWARSHCSEISGRFSCFSGDCGSGKIACNNAGGAPPATLAEFTLQGDAGKDFYDVSNVDGFNLPMKIEPKGGSGPCGSTECKVDINAICPAQLQSKRPDGKVVGCKSACLAFNTDQYCCRGAFNTASKCPPTNYSKIFKNACPQAYSYAYDDRTSTFTCTGANYLITFCP